MKALSLELHALSIAKASNDPEVKEWALQLINSNIAKLMMRRFNNERKAICYLKKNLDCKFRYVQQYTRLQLAKLYFDRNNYHGVVDLLTVLYEQEGSKFDITDKEQEMFGRFIFVISLLTIKEKKRAEYQIPFLQHLCDVFNSAGGNNLLEKIRDCF
jgi:hypothetical protein